MGGSPQQPTTYNVASMMPPPNPQGTYDIVRASSRLAGTSMDLARSNMALASKMPPVRLEYNPSEVSQQAAELGMKNWQTSQKIEQLTDPAALKMRRGMSQQVLDATSPEAFKQFLDRYARERGISAIAGTGIDPSSTIGRSAIYDATTEAGRKRALEDIAIRQAFLDKTPPPLGGIDPGANVTAQEAVKAQNVGQMNAWQASQLQNIFGLGQNYSDFVNKMMGETLSAHQAEQANMRQYQQQLINDILGKAESENAMRAAAAQGNQQLTGTLVGAGVGAVGLVAAAMI